MSDFLLSTRPVPPGELRSVLERYLAAVTARYEEHHGAWGSLAVAHAPHDRGVVFEEDGFLSVLVGDPLARLPGLPRGFARAQAPRRAVHELLRDPLGRAWDALLDGPYAALGVDTERGGGIAVSDLGGFVTLFHSAGSGGEGLVLGTHVEAVAAAAGRGGEVDPVSAADLLLNLSCAFPHTLRPGVTQHAPAVARRFDAAGWSGEGECYWMPVERSVYGSREEAAAELREAIAEDVRDACAGFPLVGILLSGGEDARAVLGAVPTGTRVRAFTYADWENREVRVARRVAERYGAEFVFGKREPGHYLEAMTEVAALLGSQHMFIDIHGYGFHERLGLRELPVVLGGLSSDSFLKAYHAPGEGGAEESFRPPPLPLIRADLVEAVVERRDAFRRWLGEMRPESAREWEKIWPFSMRKHGANYHGNRRMFASHEPYHANRVVKLAADAPLRWKYHRRLFLDATRPFLRRAWDIPHAGWRYPYFGRYPNLALTAVLRLTRGARALATGELRARQGPWPKWRRVVASPAMARLQAEHPLLDTPLAELFTTRSAAEIARVVRREWHPHRELLLLQLAYLAELGQRD